MKKREKKENTEVNLKVIQGEGKGSGPRQCDIFTSDRKRTGSRLDRDPGRGGA